MDLIGTPLFAYILAWFGFMGGIWALFDRAETVAAGDTKVAVARWLHNLDLTKILPNWPATFATVFDHVFGRHHLSQRCFFRSCIASVASVVIVTLIWGALAPDEFMAFIRSPDWRVGLLGLVSIATFLNVIPDYFSLLESRYVIQRMAAKPSASHILIFLVVDFAATLTIFIIAWVTLGALGWLIVQSGPRYESPGDALVYLVISLRDMASLHATENNFTLGICLYSTFFTSVWVWLYALSGATVKLLTHFGVGVGGLKNVLDIDEKPIRSLGFVSMLLVTVVFIIVSIVR